MSERKTRSILHQLREKPVKVTGDIASVKDKDLVIPNYSGAIDFLDVAYGS